jgi:hypothetical protein
MIHNNLKTLVHNCHETLILIFFTHQSITYAITKNIHIGIMSKLIIINSMVRRILWWHWLKEGTTGYWCSGGEGLALPSGMNSQIKEEKVRCCAIGVRDGKSI